MSVSVQLHRVLMAAPEHLYVDHHDLDGLNCRRSNLRLATEAQNSQNRRRPSTNTSGVKGVSWHKQMGKWRVQIRKGNVSTHLGLFDDLEEAGRAYMAEATRRNGEFARDK